MSGEAAMSFKSTPTTSQNEWLGHEKCMCAIAGDATDA